MLWFETTFETFLVVQSAFFCMMQYLCSRRKVVAGVNRGVNSGKSPSGRKGQQSCSWCWLLLWNWELDIFQVHSPTRWDSARTWIASGASTKEIGGVDEHTMVLCTMGMGWTTDIPGNFHGLDEHTCLFTGPMRLLRGRIATRHIRGKNSQQAFWGTLLHNTLLTQIKAVQRCASGEFCGM